MKSNEDEGKSAGQCLLQILFIVYINIINVEIGELPLYCLSPSLQYHHGSQTLATRVHGSCRKSFQFSSFSSQHSSSGPMVLLTSTNCEPKRQVFWIGIIMGFRVLYSIDDTYFCLSLATMAVLESSWLHR